MLVCAPFAWLTLHSDSLSLLKLGSSGFGLFGGLFMANIFAAAYDVIAERNYGFGTGALNMMGGFAGGAAILSAGLLKASIGMAALMQWASAATMLATVVMAIVVRRHFQADRRRAGY